MGWGFAPGSHVTEQPPPQSDTQPGSAASPSSSPAPPHGQAVQRRAALRTAGTPYHPHHQHSAYNPLTPTVGGGGGGGGKPRAHTAALHQRGTTRREVVSRGARATTAPTSASLQPSHSQSQAQQRPPSHSPFDTTRPQFDEVPPYA